MRILYLFSVIYAALILSSCATTPHPPAVETSTETTTITPPCPHHHKDPINVSVFTKPPQLNRPYQVVGKATVSKFNVAGVKRQEATIRDIMRKMAASVDGDALIDIKANEQTVSATVIAYKEIWA
jgi:hypothetical protein